MSDPSLAAQRIQHCWKNYVKRKQKVEDTHIIAAFVSVLFVNAFSIIVAFCL